MTSEGRRVRAELAAKGAGKDREPAQEPVREQGGGFVADDGSGKVAPSPRRAAEVAAAWEGLLQIRRVLMDGAADRPAPWEKDRCVHAVCLALEATGCPPARPERAGYTVTEGPEPDTARAGWTGPDGTGPLLRMAALLADRGWQATDHRTRDGEPFLLISPRR
ncbi:hypothetical protein [Actinacidiphila acididurans]|uniref:Uncharacterized protein n=1 Tax=Actinacidiphila acididurans TaxID=2784346 RepID=A0ABS2U407_9ACTN|nr:hypothetical protein [Actinacidiphila acididurans]MBM9510324.1 hypothetical protein [Actinacidiphila acididurans]